MGNRIRQWGAASAAAVVAATATATLGATAVAAATEERLAGGDRFSTSVQIATARFPSAAPTVYLARGDVLVDALAAGVLTRGPLLLVPPCGGVPADVAGYIDRVGPERVVALGGESAVCDATLLEAAGGRRTGRLAGANRFATAAAISAEQFGAGAPIVYLADGLGGVDAVAGGALVDGPILLIDRGELPAATRDEIERLKPTTVVALGGPDAVRDSLLQAAANGRGVDRVSGPDRFATAAAIARRVFPSRAMAVYWLEPTCLPTRSPAACSPTARCCSCPAAAVCRRPRQPRSAG